MNKKRQKWNPNNFFSPCYFIQIYKDALFKYGKEKFFYGSRFLPEREAFATAALTLTISKKDKKRYIVRVNPKERDDVDTFVGHFIGKGPERTFKITEVQILEFTKFSLDIYLEIRKKLKKGYRKDVVFCVFINKYGKIPAIKTLHSRLLAEGINQTYQKDRQIWFISRTSEEIHTAYLVWPKMWYSNIALEKECSKPSSIYGVTPIEIKERKIIINKEDLKNF